MICYADTRVLHVDTIPYDEYHFETNARVCTSPCARSAKTISSPCSQQQAFSVQSLSLYGRYELSMLNDWLNILSHFPFIRTLDLAGVNISNSTDLNIETLHPHPLHLPRLIALRYVRSKRCEIHLPLFLFLVTNAEITPRLRALTLMYGDLIHLCKRLPDHVFRSNRRTLVVK